MCDILEEQLQPDGGQSFSIPLAEGSDQKGSDTGIPEILFILQVRYRKKKSPDLTLVI
jgi:hypothetical protein